LQLAEVSQISKTIHDLANKNAKIIFGIDESSDYEDKIKITLLAIGCTVKPFFVKTEPKETPSKPKTPTRIKKSGPKKRERASLSVTGKKIKQKESKEPPKLIKTIKKNNKGKKSMIKENNIPIKIKRKPENIPGEQKKIEPTILAGKNIEQVKVRRNALELRKVVEQEEKELLEQEKAWETPAIFRKAGRNINTN